MSNPSYAYCWTHKLTYEYGPGELIQCPKCIEAMRQTSTPEVASLEWRYKMALGHYGEAQKEIGKLESQNTQLRAHLTELTSITATLSPDSAVATWEALGAVTGKALEGLK